ncbi:MAG TPA: aminotransferase class I/II-fold pyridoxal phosphate-dependent enzyme [Bacteroidia bacterium]|nr:aminotransferase class I/II-fold pyridoxal phosphate-dependent enzyme [Bacteroidia bacterium]
MEISYILNHLGEDREHYYNAVNPPMMLTSNFCFPDLATMREELKHELETPFYTRGYNPTVAILRKKLAALEGTDDALVFSSGSAAVAAAIMSVVKSGDHVVCIAKPYSWTGNLLSKYLVNYGVETTFANEGTVAAFSSAVKNNTKLIYLESPNSMTFELQDIEGICRFAKTKSITTIIDNSYNSPLNQQPAKLGADIVVHSATKYLNGHSDVVAGVVASSKQRISEMMAKEYMTLGAVIGAHDAWMMIRGLRTLELRVQRSASSAQMIAEWLEQHPKVEKVFYPFLSSNKDFQLAKKQMKSGGGLLSILLKTENVNQIEKFCNALKCFLLATSWGGHESLCFPVCALAGAESFKNKSGLQINLVRLYIGLEDPEMLRKDLGQALDQMS